MSKTTDIGFSNGIVSGETAWEPTTHQLDWANEFAIESEVPGKVIYTDLTAPIDRPSRVTIAQRTRANVYQGTSIDPAMYLPSKRGLDTLVEVSGIAEVTDSELADYLKQFPYRAALTVTVPQTSLLSSSQMGGLVLRLIQSICTDNPSVADGWDDGLTLLLRGVLKRA